jgi:hypothetical protein
LVPVLILLVIATGGIAGWKAYQDHRHEKQLRIAAISSSDAAQSSSAPQNAASGNSTSPSVAAPASVSASSASPVAANNIPGSPTADQASHGVAPASATAANTGGAPLAAGTFEVTVRPKDAAWVSIKSDGNFVVRGIIKPPDVKTIRASSQVVFFTGNAGAVEVSFNGKNVPLAADPNQEQVLVFDSRGIVRQAAGRPPAAEQPAAQQPTAQ